MNSNLQLATAVEKSAVNLNKHDSFLFMATLKAPHYEAEKRSPLDLVCVVDRSGSMQGQKMNLVLDTLKFVIGQLTPTDRLSVVIYDTEIETLFDLTYMDGVGKELANDKVTKVTARGGTDLCGGLVKGLDVLRNRKTKNEVASVLLFTDGLANAGYSRLEDILRSMSDVNFSRFHQPNYIANAYPTMQQMQVPMQQQMPVQQMQQVQQMRMPMQQQMQMPMQQQVQQMQMPMQQMQMPVQQQMQIPPSLVVPDLPEKHEPLPGTVYTFGFGADHDPVLLKGIAEKGNGVYYFIEDTDSIPEAFADCLGGLLSVAAQNITLRFESKNGVNINKLLTKFKHQEITPGKVYELTIGDIQSEEQRDIIVRVELPAIQQDNPEFEIADVSVNYFNVITSQSATATSKATVQRLANVPTTITRNVELDKQNNRLLAAEAMEKATVAGNSGKLDEARKIIQDAISIIQSSISGNQSFCQSLVVDLRTCADNLRDVTTYNNTGAKMLHNNINAHYMQRSTNVKMASQQAYQTSSRQEKQMQQQQIFKKA